MSFQLRNWRFLHLNVIYTKISTPVFRKVVKFPIKMDFLSKMLSWPEKTASSYCLFPEHFLKRFLLFLGNSTCIHDANISVQYTAIFHGCKNGNFRMKKSDIFLIFPQNIDRGYTLEPP